MLMLSLIQKYPQRLEPMNLRSHSLGNLQVGHQNVNTRPKSGTIPPQVMPTIMKNLISEGIYPTHADSMLCSTSV